MIFKGEQTSDSEINENVKDAYLRVLSLLSMKDYVCDLLSDHKTQRSKW